MDDQAAVRALAALANPRRLAVFRHLIAAGPSGLTAGEIAAAIGIGATALTFHLKELDRAGLIRSWRTGRAIRSAVAVDVVRQLVGFLVDDCCQGRPELCGDGLRADRTVCCGDDRVAGDIEWGSSE